MTVRPPAFGPQYSSGDTRDNRMNGNPNRPNLPPQRTNKPGSPSTIWWAVLAGLLLWNLFTLWPQPKPELHVAYSTFLEQVKAGNVKEVLITGDRIRGQFVKPIPGPQPADENPASKGGKTGSASQASNGSTAHVSFPEADAWICIRGAAIHSPCPAPARWA